MSLFDPSLRNQGPAELRTPVQKASDRNLCRILSRSSLWCINQTHPHSVLLLGHQLRLAASHAGARPDHQRTRRPALDPLRQWPGADQPALFELVHRTQDRAATYPAGQAHAERAAGKLQRQAARGVFECELVPEPVRRAREDLGLAHRVQPAATAQQFGLQNTERVCSRAKGQGLLRGGGGARGLKRRPLAPHPHPRSRRGSG